MSSKLKDQKYFFKELSIGNQQTLQQLLNDKVAYHEAVKGMEALFINVLSSSKTPFNHTHNTLNRTVPTYFPFLEGANERITNCVVQLVVASTMRAHQRQTGS